MAENARPCSGRSAATGIDPVSWWFSFDVFCKRIIDIFKAESSEDIDWVRKKGLEITGLVGFVQHFSHSKNPPYLSNISVENKSSSSTWISWSLEKLGKGVFTFPGKGFYTA